MISGSLSLISNTGETARAAGGSLTSVSALTEWRRAAPNARQSVSRLSVSSVTGVYVVEHFFNGIGEMQASIDDEL